MVANKSSGAKTVEVVYAAADRVHSVSVALEPGATLREAVERSGLLERCPEIDLARNRVGVYGQLRELDTPLRPGDRVEIYRPLKIDPKEARRRRAAARARKS